VGTTAVLVISGPIASGKSSAANAMATQVRSAGRTAAVVDLDRLYMMLDDASHMDDDSVWRLARRAAAALTDQFVADGIDTVIVEGTFWTPSEREQFTVHLASGVQPRFMTLQVSVAEAMRRVQLDTGRRASRIPELLRASHASFAALAPIASDVIVDTTRATKADVVAAITAMLATSPRQGERE